MMEKDDWKTLGLTILIPTVVCLFLLAMFILRRIIFNK